MGATNSRSPSHENRVLEHTKPSDLKETEESVSMKLEAESVIRSMTLEPNEVKLCDVSHYFQEDTGSKINLKNEPLKTMGFVDRENKVRGIHITNHESIFAEAERLLTLSDSLNALVVSNCGLRKLFSQIFSLVNLRKLDLSRNLLTSIPNHMEQLKSLEILDVSSNQIRYLPDSICQCLHLRSINANSNALNQLPSDIGNLHRLEELHVARNNIEEIPSSFERLGCLLTSNLSNNRLFSFSKTFYRLSQLKSLQLGFNSMTVEANNDSFSFSSSLMIHLDIRSNKLRQFPVRFCSATLRIVAAGSNQISALPKEIGKMKQLRTLLLSNNEIRSLPSSLCTLPALRVINLSHNRLTLIPKRIFELPYLQSIDLSNNDIEAVPVPPEMTALNDLRLWNNPRLSIPNIILQEPYAILLKYLRAPLQTRQDLQVSLSRPSPRDLNSKNEIFAGSIASSYSSLPCTVENTRQSVNELSRISVDGVSDEEEITL